MNASAISFKTSLRIFLSLSDFRLFLCFSPFLFLLLSIDSLLSSVCLCLLPLSPSVSTCFCLLLSLSLSVCLFQSLSLAISFCFRRKYKRQGQKDRQTGRLTHWTGNTQTDKKTEAIHFSEHKYITKINRIQAIQN